MAGLARQRWNGECLQTIARAVLHCVPWHAGKPAGTGRSSFPACNRFRRADRHLLRRMPRDRIAQQFHCGVGQRFPIGDTDHGPEAPAPCYRQSDTVDKLTAGADVGAYSRHTGGIALAFQAIPAAALRYRTEHHQADFRQQIGDFLETEKLDVIAQPQAGDHRLRHFLPHIPALRLRPGNPAFRCGMRLTTVRIARMKVLMSLDRHHSSNQGTGSAVCPPAAVRAKVPAPKIDAVGNVAACGRSAPSRNLAQMVGFIKRDDVVGGVVAQRAERLRRSGSQLAENSDFGRSFWNTLRLPRKSTPLWNRSICALGDAVFRQQQYGRGAPSASRREKPA